MSTQLPYETARPHFAAAQIRCMSCGLEATVNVYTRELADYYARKMREHSPTHWPCARCGSYIHTVTVLERRSP